MFDKTPRQLTTYCGLWCGDCVPAQSELFDALRRFIALATKHRLRDYAASKLGSVPEFAGYDVMEDVLQAVLREECSVHCVDGPFSEANCSPACPIRTCVLGQGLAGCWECPTYRECPHIQAMLPRHPAQLDNLARIAAEGIERWHRTRGIHHPWQTEADLEGRE
ncbi:MAG: DUF3795 domain-containing protein [Planctomycetaceae bacterium]|nr:DUF3795 domain-containing protein [Planctomycetaceae bacterium]